MELNLPSPLDALKLHSGVTIFLKRDDLIHTSISGNKWRKIKGFVEGSNFSRIITMGGSFSNHIHAVSNFGKLHNIPTLGFIRGEIDHQNPCVRDALSNDMRLISLSRSAYRALRQDNLSIIKDHFKEEDLWIPEGGKGRYGRIGFEQCVKEIKIQESEPFQDIVIAVGTGTSLAGIAEHYESAKIWAIMAVADPSIIERLERSLQPIDFNRIYWVLPTEFGGIGRFNSKIVEYCLSFKRDFDVSLDLNYTAKAMWNLERLLEEGLILKTSRILFYHSGGTQGNRGFNYLYKDLPTLPL